MTFWGVTLYNSIPAYNSMSSNSLFTCAITQDLTIQLEIVYKMRKAWSILPSIRCSRHVPFAENHLQILMFPPPCFTVGMVFSGLYSSFVLQTRQVEFIPKSYILVSSDHITFSHASSGSSRWSLANFRRA